MSRIEPASTGAPARPSTQAAKGASRSSEATSFKQRLRPEITDPSDPDKRIEPRASRTEIVVCEGDEVLAMALFASVCLERRIDDAPTPQCQSVEHDAKSIDALLPRLASRVAVCSDRVAPLILVTFGADAPFSGHFVARVDGGRRYVSMASKSLDALRRIEARLLSVGIEVDVIASE